MGRGGLIRFRLRSRGARELLRSDGVRGDLEERAENVAQAVRSTDAPGVLSHGPEGIVADSYIGSGRVGATVIGVPLAYEEEHRVLGGAIDAAGST